ncbi:hypothetical protein RB653_009555 [Dictyostelium firmibasis]|uniref:Transmembrane protein n=1 Tax=Dictyostelium firmibasis TaxID=79012 RepID=A0AAN7U1C5_9MYCE
MYIYILLILFKIFFSSNSLELESYSLVDDSIVLRFNDTVTDELSLQYYYSSENVKNVFDDLLSVFPSDNGYYFDISQLVLPRETQNPYSIKYSTSGVNRVFYFNFGPLDYCQNLRKREKEYQSCILINQTNTVLHSGGTERIYYSTSVPTKLTLLYFRSIDNTSCQYIPFNLKCNQNENFRIMNLTHNNDCDLEVYIESRYFCSINSNINYTFLSPNQVFFKTKNNTQDFVTIFVNGKKKILDFSQIPKPASIENMNQIKSPPETPIKTSPIIHSKNTSLNPQNLDFNKIATPSEIQSLSQKPNQCFKINF